MKINTISLVSGAALFALTGAASAGPMDMAAKMTVTPELKIEQVHYDYHHGPYEWHRHRYYYAYNNWNPGAALGLAALPFAWQRAGLTMATPITAIRLRA